MKNYEKPIVLSNEDKQKGYMQQAEPLIHSEQVLRAVRHRLQM